MVSRQRAYNQTFENQIKGLTAAAQYTQFFQAAESPSFKFMQDQARHVGVKCEKKLAKPDHVVPLISNVVSKGGTCILGFVGVDEGSNWGHATAIGKAKAGGGKASFFDPNQGQFSWPERASKDIIAQEILGNLKAFYGVNSIRDYVVYELS